MERLIDWRVFFVVMSPVALLVFRLHRLVHLNVWICLGLLVGAILLNGLVATFEDETPGGFYNPMPDDPRDKR